MLHVVGDVHGQFDKLQTLLLENGLLSQEGIWTGNKDDRLLFIGDLFDRGKAGIESLELVMRLCQQDRADMLLGNHECFILGALFFPDFYIEELDVTMKQHWLNTGGNEPDLERITEAHIAFLMNCPFMLKRGDTLFAHADSTIYLDYGRSVEEVNGFASGFLKRKKPEEYIRVVEDFSDKLAFYQHEATLEHFLNIYGAKQLVHGHTPISFIDESHLNQPFYYSTAVNVDGGMYLGGNGFIYSLEP